MLLLADSLDQAAVMIDAFREELMRNGKGSQAMSIRGLELLDRDDACTAILILQSMESGEDLDQVRLYTIATLERAVAAAA